MYKLKFPVLGVSRFSMRISCVEAVCMLITLCFVDNASSNGKITSRIKSHIYNIKLMWRIEDNNY